MSKLAQELAREEAEANRQASEKASSEYVAPKGSTRIYASPEILAREASKAIPSDEVDYGLPDGYQGDIKYRSTSPTGVTYIPPEMKVFKTYNQVPEWLVHQITESDQRLVDALNSINKDLNWMREYMGATKWTYSGYDPKLIGAQVTEAVKQASPIISGAISEDLANAYENRFNPDDIYKNIRDVIVDTVGAVWSSPEKALEQLGLKSAVDDVSLIKDTLGRFASDLALSELAFKQASGDVTRLPKGYYDAAGKDRDLYGIGSYKDVETISRYPFATSLGIFRAGSNLKNLAISNLNSSGKYRYSKYKKDGYIKSRYGSYYIQAIKR